MLDRFDRPIDYLRVSVTDRCNLRCTYCMPSDGVALKDHADLLTYEQITAVASAASRLGITKVRLTGGEPLVRRGIENLVGQLAALRGIAEVCMTTNGTLLAARARQLRECGLASVNISIDTLDSERYGRITRTGRLGDALAGVDAALAAGLPVKVNMVVLADTTEAELESMRRFCAEHGTALQLINHFSLGDHKRSDYHYDRPPRCRSCNKIRLLADGVLRPCLHSDREMKVDFSDLEECVRTTILAKPKNGARSTKREMYQIGG